uniref:Uncharacterized protein n=1 Tax=Rhizophora mucronata TaxID=61149 RepID=A0A2P2KUU2_RHIMU
MQVGKSLSSAGVVELCVSCRCKHISLFRTSKI